MCDNMSPSMMTTKYKGEVLTLALKETDQHNLCNVISLVMIFTMLDILPLTCVIIVKPSSFIAERISMRQIIVFYLRFLYIIYIC